MAVVVALAALVLPASAGTRALPVAGAPDDTAIESGLKALHQGEFGRAAAGFEQAARSSPGAPVPLFFVVFSRWWQLVFAESPTPKTDPMFDQGVEETLRAARARLEASPKDAPALAVLGGAQVLQAHLEAMRGNYFRSGSEARRGKKALEQALEVDGGLDMALFPAGALNYFADRVPLVVKGLRPLFFFPGGDAAKGLRQIRQVADGHGPFRTDGRLLLAQICADRYQKSYREALDHFRLALDENPGSPLIAGAIGDLQIRLGEYTAATATLKAALATIPADGPERSRQRQWLQLGLTEAAMGDFRIEEAEEILRQAVSGPDPLSPSLRKTQSRLEQELAQKRKAATLLAASPSLHGSGEVPAAVDEAIRADPGNAVARYLRGRILLQAGRPAEAILSLGEAAAADGAPAWLAGWSEVLSGMAEARLGHLKESRAHYRKASGIRHFRAADRARLELGEKGEDAEACSGPKRPGPG